MLVDRDRDRLQSGRGEHARPPAVRGILNGDPFLALLAEHRPDLEQRLRRAGEDADPAERRDGPARPAEKLRDLDPQPVRARTCRRRRSRSSPHSRRRARHERSHSARGKSARSGRSGRRLKGRPAIGTSGPRSIGSAACPPAATSGGAPRRSVTYASAASCAYALTTTPREIAEVGGERARRREHVADRQQLGPDQRPHALLDLEPERPRAVEVELEKWSCPFDQEWPFPQDQHTLRWRRAPRDPRSSSRSSSPAPRTRALPGVHLPAGADLVRRSPTWRRLVRRRTGFTSSARAGRSGWRSRRQAAAEAVPEHRPARALEGRRAGPALDRLPPPLRDQPPVLRRLHRAGRERRTSSSTAPRRTAPGPCSGSARQLLFRP